MKILFAPLNVASMFSITADAMNKLEGHEAKYIHIANNNFISGSDAALKYPQPFLQYHNRKTNPLKWVLYQLEVKSIYWIRVLLFLYKWIRWADVVHWSWDGIREVPFDADIKLAKWMKKKRFVEWVGSDIRIPEITMKESKLYQKLFNQGYEYALLESQKHSYRVQEKFAAHGYRPILVPEMQLYLKPGLFSHVHTTFYRVFEEEKYVINKTATVNDKVVILHSPTAPVAKGSVVIQPIVEKLAHQYDIEFRFITNVTREQVLYEMKHCDIYVDQIVLGSYATAAVEALSFGKTVVAYIMPSVYQKGIPDNCPIVNANADNLEALLKSLIKDKSLRNELGIKGRRYAEEFHNAQTLAKELIAIYQVSDFQ